MMADTAPVRVLVVDDEPLAREKIREMARDDAEIEIVGECANGDEAVAAVRRESPDLLLLDVQMPESDGFAVLEALQPSGVPLVIFVTAYDQYAVRAFEVHAFDYLLKPFDRERFCDALRRAKEQIRRERSNNGTLDHRILALLEQIKGEPKYLERLVVKNAGRVFFLDTGEVDWIEAEGNYVQIHMQAKAHLLRETIGSLEARLDPRKFVRIHRSTIVNVDRIQELQPWTHGDYYVILRNGTRLTASRNYRENLQAALGDGL